VKRIVWFALGAVAGVLAYPRISQKVAQLGHGETLMQAQDWVSSQIDVVVDQVVQGGSTHGVS
jgi:tryptophan synthase beta subunit